MFEQLINSKAGASAAAEAAKGIFGGDPGNVLSGGTADMRTSFNNSGWTVATGAGKADAKNTGDPVAATYGASTSPAVQAGMGWPMMLALAGLAFVVIKKQKGG